MLVLADNIDKDAIVKSLVSAGRVDTRGGGILYEYPVDKAIVNLPTLMGKRNELANTRQMAAAIDELMGNTDWRSSVAMSEATDKHTADALAAKTDKDLSMLSLVVPRKHTDMVMDAIIHLGAPGANVNYVKHLAGEQDIDASGFAIHHEMAFVRAVLPTNDIPLIEQGLQAFCSDNNIMNVAIFEQTLARVVR